MALFGRGGSKGKNARQTIDLSVLPEPGSLITARSDAFLFEGNTPVGVEQVTSVGNSVGVRGDGLETQGPFLQLRIPRIDVPGSLRQDVELALEWHRSGVTRQATVRVCRADEHDGRDGEDPAVLAAVRVAGEPEVIQRRRYVRVAVNFPFTLAPAGFDGAGQLEGTTSDLCEGGLSGSISSVETLRIGDGVIVRLTVPAPESPLMLTGTVRRIVADTKSIALEFPEYRQHSDTLRGVVYRQQLAVRATD